MGGGRSKPTVVYERFDQEIEDFPQGRTGNALFEAKQRMLDRARGMSISEAYDTWLPRSIRPYLGKLRAAELALTSRPNDDQRHRAEIRIVLNAAVIQELRNRWWVLWGFIVAALGSLAGIASLFVSIILLMRDP